MSRQNISGKALSTSRGTKLVLNPVATYSPQFKQDPSTPQYQTDKIIIPTKIVNQKKSSATSESKMLPAQKEELPTFFTKAYSLTPNASNVRGILGVEYIVKILKSASDVSPRFECGLCELVLDSFAMQCHLEGYSHRLKYCQKHFPTAIRHYRQYMQGVPEQDMFKVMTPILTKLAIAIEKHHGRNLPYECYARDFSLNRHQILAKAFSCRHASEQCGPTFTHVIDSKEIVQLISERHKFTPIPENKSGEDRVELENSHQNFAKDRHTYTNENNVGSETRNVRVYDIPDRNIIDGGRKCHEHRKRLSTTFQTTSLPKRRTVAPLHNPDFSEAYSDLVHQHIIDLKERFKGYGQDPESYPYYNDEWQKFWKLRKGELIAAGLDHHTYNYQHEWIIHIKQRLNDLFNDELENIKQKSRERLDLPNGIKRHDQSKFGSPVTYTNTSTISTTTSNMVVPDAGYESSKIGLSHSHVVSVLQLMTVFDEYLGSVGPKIGTLLSKTLQQVNKNGQELVNDMIFNDRNCMLLETAKDKLKSLLRIGILEGSKERAAKKIIYEVEIMLFISHQLSSIK